MSAPTRYSFHNTKELIETVNFEDASAAKLFNRTSRDVVGGSSVASASLVVFLNYESILSESISMPFFQR